MKRGALAVAIGLVLVAAAAAPAAAQGVVLAPDSQPLPVARVRALLVFQDFGDLAAPALRGSANREDLLVELELAAPAPAGAVWLLAAPGGASARPGSPAALDELAAFWRGGRAEADPAAPAPAPPTATAGPAIGAVAGPLELSAAVAQLRERHIALDAEAELLTKGQAEGGWRFFLAEVPAGARRAATYLTFNSEIALYPGALGAVPQGALRGRQWRLPPTELMFLHPHFLNLDDNTAGLAPRLGLAKSYQDSGTLQDGGQLWARPAESRPGPVRDSAASLGGVAAFMTTAAPDAKLFLTVVAGAPRSAERADLDFTVRSHYPSAVEPLSAGRSFLVLAAVSLVLVVLAGWLLKKRGFAP